MNVYLTIFTGVIRWVNIVFSLWRNGWHFPWIKHVINLFVLDISSSSIASEALVTFVNLIVESSLRYQAKQTFLLWPKWLVNQVNSASLMSSSCKTVDRYFLVRVGVIRWGFSRFSIFFVIDWRVSHSFR